MKIESISLQTDLLLWRHLAKVTDRGAYLVIETPGNPGFYWGNLLIFAQPPGEKEVELWPEIFAREFVHQPEVRHQAFEWDTVTAELGRSDQFVARGFEVEVSDALVATSMRRPEHFNDDIRIRTMDTDADWQALFDLEMAVGPGDEPIDAYTKFLALRMADQRALIERGHGRWYGAELRGELIGAAGFFDDGLIGRFQEVKTHPNYRRRGVCGSLIYTAGTRALEAGVASLVIVAADDEFGAARVYRSVGFEGTERVAGLCRMPQAE